MTKPTLQTQAARLKQFLSQHPEHAQGLAQLEDRSCLFAVAALEGPEALQALAVGTRVTASLSAALPAPLAGRMSRFAPKGVHPSGQAVQTAVPIRQPALPWLPSFTSHDVLYLQGRSGAGKTTRVIEDLQRLLSSGRTATVLDIGGGSYEKLKGRSSDAAGSPASVTDAVASQAPLLAVDFTSWQLSANVLTPEDLQLGACWAALRALLLPRMWTGHLLVVDEIGSFHQMFGQRWAEFVTFLRDAKDAGALVVLIGQAEDDFIALSHELPPSSWIQLF